MPALHPTILIGFGEYGQQVLTQLLTSAASRGLLAWEAPSGAANPAASRIRDLSAIWIPDVSADRGPRPDEAIGAASPDIIKDLYQQIVALDPAGDLDAKFLAAVESARAYLLDASRRASDDARLRLGLDVIVFARPTQSSVLGALERLLTPAVTMLAADASLRRPAQGSDLLNVIQVLDFENFWDPSSEGQGLRREVAAWLTRMNAPPRPGFSRVYFSDERTLDGTRSAAKRVEETVLFLEFLLFEGLRDDPSLRLLYQRERDDRTVLAAFGIRIFERSTGLLSRLTAAYFANGWLDYLGAAASHRAGDGLTRLRSLLDEYGPAALQRDVSLEAFLEIAHLELEALEADLLAVPVDAPDWSARVNQVAQQGLRKVRRRLLDRARDRAKEITARKLDGLPDLLQATISDALHGQTPEPAGGVIRELEELDGALREPLAIADVAEPEPAPLLLTGLDRVHEQYLRLRQEQVDTPRLKNWWPLAAATVASAFTPLIIDGIRELTPPDPEGPYLVRRSIEVLAAWGTPAFVVPIVWLAAWLLGRFVVQRAIHGRVERAKRYFIDPERGRLADCVRGAVRDGPIRRVADAHALQVYRETTFRIRNEVQKQVDRVQSALRTRVLEMQWLRNQLREYLRLHGVDTRHPDRVSVATVDSGDLRHWIDLREELGEMLKRNRPSPERFQSTQASFKPFVSWIDQYSEAFLYPVSFLDRLSEIYEQPLKRDWSAPDDDARRQLVKALVALLGRRSASDFHPGFNWEPMGFDAIPNTDKYAVVPREWQNLPGLQSALQEHAWTRIQTGHAPDRLFLLQFQCSTSLELG
jgi:hypothetical protein